MSRLPVDPPVLSQIAAFSIVTHLYRTEMFPTFDRARPGACVPIFVVGLALTLDVGLAYVLNIVSWILGVLVTAGVVTTGISANRGHRWAAGNRAYRPIDG